MSTFSLQELECIRDILIAQASIEHVISHFIDLKKKGTRYGGRCPFHLEKTGSFFIFPETQRYYCFGCGAKGDMIDFVQKYRGCSYVKALSHIAAIYNIEMTAGKPMRMEDPCENSWVTTPMVGDKLAFPGKRKFRKGRDFEKKPTILSHSKIPYPYAFVPLGDPSIEEINEYVQNRGFSIDALRAKGYGGCTRGFYAKRLIIPCFMDGVLAFWQARDIYERSKQERKKHPKYLNPKGVPSGNCIYNLDRAVRHPIVVLQEGALDVESTGDDAAGTYGCNITQHQLRILWLRGVRYICLCHDKDTWFPKKVEVKDKFDSKGEPIFREIEATILSNGRQILQAGFSLSLAYLEDGDPAEMGPDQTRLAIDRAIQVESEDELALRVAERIEGIAPDLIDEDSSKGFEPLNDVELLEMEESLLLGGFY